MKHGIKHEPSPEFRISRSGHPQLEHESVARGGGELESLLFLDAVPIGEHRHMRKSMFAVERGNGTFSHRAQEQRLDLRPRAVDLVEEESNETLAMAKQRARLDARRAFCIDIRVIYEVSGHEVDRAFNTLEVATDGAGECAEDCGLSDAYVAFEENVTPGKQRHIDEPDCVLLADDRLGYFLFHAKRAGPPILQFIVCHGLILRSGAGTHSRDSVTRKCGRAHMCRARISCATSGPTRREPCPSRERLSVRGQ